MEARGKSKKELQVAKHQPESSVLELELVSVHPLKNGNIVHVFATFIKPSPDRIPCQHRILKIWNPKTKTFIAETSPIYDEGNYWSIFSASDDEFIVLIQHKCIQRWDAKTLAILQELNCRYESLEKLPQTDWLITRSSDEMMGINAKDLAITRILLDGVGNFCALPSGLIVATPPPGIRNTLYLYGADLKQVSSFNLEHAFYVGYLGNDLRALSERFILIQDITSNLRIIFDLSNMSTHTFKWKVENIILLDDAHFICTVDGVPHWFDSKTFCPQSLNLKLPCDKVRDVVFSPETNTVVMTAMPAYPAKSYPLYLRSGANVKALEDEIVATVAKFAGSRPLANIIAEYSRDPLQLSLIDTKEPPVAEKDNIFKMMYRLFQGKKSGKQASVPEGHLGVRSNI